MKSENRRMLLAAIPPLLLLFILYCLKFLETGMGWSFASWGIYPRQVRGMTGILTAPLVHAGFSHLLGNTVPLFFLSWCLFYFYRQISLSIYAALWVGCGLLTFFFGKPGWHIGASGLVYGLAFFLFFSGVLRKHVPLMAISLLVTFLYGSIVWNMFPQFAKATTSWEGHLGGAITGTFCSVLFMRHGPQCPDPFTDEADGEDETDGEDNNADSPANESSGKPDSP